MVRWKFWEKKALLPIEVKKVAAIKGEFTPGELSVDLGTYNENGEPLQVATIPLVLKIVPEIRPTVNRLLLGLGSQADKDLLDLYISKTLG